MRNVILVGGSAGALQALRTVVAQLPADLPAALLSVIHLGEGTSHLPEILQRSTALEVVRPEKPEPISPRHV